MKVQFLTEKLDQLHEQTKQFVHVGNEYNVYGIEIENGIVKFYISLNENSFYPKLIPADFFVVKNNRLSRYWNFEATHNKVKIQFKDWIDVPNFMRYFVEGDVEVEEDFFKLKSFQEYKKIIDDEFR